MIKLMLEDYIEDYPYWRSVTVAVEDKQLFIEGIHELGLDWKLGHEDGNGRIGLKIYGEQKDLADLADYVDSRKSKTESFGRIKLREQDVEIEVKNKGILEVPEGKNVDDLPMSHFEKLVKKHGLSKITKALNNLQVWNKNDDKKLSKWAGDMIDKLNKKLKKDEAILHDRYTLTMNGAIGNVSPKMTFDSVKDAIDYAESCDIYNFYMITDETGNVVKRGKCNKKNKKNEAVIRESAAEKDLYDDLYSYADQYRMTSRWTKANVEKYLERQKNFRRMSDADFQKVVDKVNKDFKRKKKVKSFPYDSNSYKNESFIKEFGAKSYWSYDLMNVDDDRYYDKQSIRRIKLTPCDNPDDCYADFGDTTSWAVCDTDYGNEVFCTKDQAYSYLLDTINRNRYEREHDI